MPPELRALLDKFLSDIALESAAMGADRKSIDDWQRAMAQDLLVYHYASYGTGRGAIRFSPKEQARINEQVGQQLDYLNKYAAELDTRGWEAKDAARSALYAGSIKSTFWRGKTFGYDLPAYPTEGSPCMVNCACAWDMNELDPEELDADFTWKLGATEHCEVCRERARVWAPLRFRGGEMV